MLGHIEYDEYGLLELFESEPGIVFEKETGVFIYSKVDSRGIKLTMDFSVYENSCGIGLSYSMETYDSPIIDIDLDDVICFCCTSKKLTIQRDSRRDIEIIFNPNFMLKFIQV